MYRMNFPNTVVYYTALMSNKKLKCIRDISEIKVPGMCF